MPEGTTEMMEEGSAREGGLQESQIREEGDFQGIANDWEAEEGTASAVQEQSAGADLDAEGHTLEEYEESEEFMDEESDSGKQEEEENLVAAGS